MVDTTAPKKSYQGLTAGALFMLIAIAILVAWSTGDWWLIIPILLIGGGLIAILIGISISATAPGRGFGFSDSSYMLVWGGILTILGVAWLINATVPDAAPLLIAIVLLFIGGAIVGISLTRKNKTRKTA